MEELVVQLVAGAVGGNIAGVASKKLHQGTLINTLAGLVGGGIGGQLLQTVTSSGMLDGVAGDVAGGGVGGAVALALLGVVRNFLKQGR